MGQLELHWILVVGYVKLLDFSVFFFAPPILSFGLEKISVGFHEAVLVMLF